MGGNPHGHPKQAREACCPKQAKTSHFHFHECLSIIDLNWMAFACIISEMDEKERISHSGLDERLTVYILLFFATVGWQGKKGV